MTTQAFVAIPYAQVGALPALCSVSNPATSVSPSSRWIVVADHSGTVTLLNPSTDSNSIKVPHFMFESFVFQAFCASQLLYSCSTKMVFVCSCLYLWCNIVNSINRQYGQHHSTSPYLPFRYSKALHAAYWLQQLQKSII
jgi:hypothetical protein